MWTTRCSPTGATLIAFTGTPLTKADANTREVFGAGKDYIDVYDLKRAVDDEATVRVYHEPRLIPVSLPPHVDPETIDAQADALTADMDDAERRRAVQYAAHMNNVYGAPDRIRTLAEDLVAHWELRSELMRPQLGGPGKAMIVCVSREVCVKVYDALAELRPRWAYEAVDQSKMRLFFTVTPANRSTCASTPCAPPSTGPSKPGPMTRTTSWSCSSSTRCCSPGSMLRPFTRSTWIARCRART
ncbi:MAG: hypothetical protein ACRDRQ_01925 [Pseudonocardiaceae bacterium]